MSALDVRTFALWAGLSGLVPRIAVVAGRCFAGNAVVAGSSDILIATRDATLGVAGPAMVSGRPRGLHPEQLGPSDVMAANGVIDVVVDGESQAVEVAGHLVRLFAGPAPTVAPPIRRLCAPALPDRERSPYDVRPDHHHTCGLRLGGVPP